MLDQQAVADPDHVQAAGLKRGAGGRLAEEVAGSPAQAERFLGVLLEGITPR